MSIKQAVFQLNGEDYGLGITEVHTVEKDMSIYNMANTPKNVKGKLNLRGVDIPVYSLRRKFSLVDKKPDNDTRYLISSVNGLDIAFEVDNVQGILDIETSSIYDFPQVIKDNNTSYIKSIAHVDDRLILLLDSNQLLDREEIKALQSRNEK